MKQGNKYEVPMAILKPVEEKLREHRNLIFAIANPDDIYFYDLRSIHAPDLYHFRIYKDNPRRITVNNPSGIQVYYDVVPYYRHEVKITHTACAIDNIPDALLKWVSILEEYDQAKSVYDDPVLKGFIREIGGMLNVIDADMDDPLDFENQLFFENYINKRRLEIINEHSLDEVAKETLNIILDDLGSLIQRGTITSFRNKFIIFLATSRKHSFKYFKDLLIELPKEIIKEEIRKFLTGV